MTGSAGGLMHLAGRRQWVRLHPDAIVWRTVFSRLTRVPWHVVHHVGLPATGGSGTSTYWADSGYWNAGVDIINAHKEWPALR